MEGTTLLDNGAFGEPREASGDQGSTFGGGTEVCPTCKGKGVVPKTNHTKVLYNSSDTLSDSAILQRPTITRFRQIHLPSFNAIESDHPCLTTDSTDSSSCALSERPDKNFDEQVRRSVMKLNHHEWDIKKDGLEECLRIAQHHQIEIDLHMNQIYRTMRYLVTNHRPKDTLFVCKMARRYFYLLQSTCKPEFDEFVCALLVRTADSSLNVRCYVNDALDKMVTYIPPVFALRPLLEKGAVHKNPLVRTATIRLISEIISYKTPTAIFTYPCFRESCQKIIETGAKLLADNSLGTRAAAKNLFSKLVNHEEFNRMYESCNIDVKLKNRIDRTLDMLRDRKEDEM